MSPFTALLQKLRGKGTENSHDSLLRQLSLFRSLTRRERGLIELILHERTYVAGEVIWGRGEEGLGMYIVVEGSVEAILTDTSGPRRLGTLGTGETFGEMSLLEETPRSIDLIAAESPTRLLSLFRPDLAKLIEGHPRLGNKLAFELARNLARRLLRLIEEAGAAPQHHLH